MLKKLYNGVILSILIFGLGACDSKINNQDTNTTEVSAPIIDDSNNTDNYVTQDTSKPTLNPNILPSPLALPKPTISPSPSPVPDTIKPIITLYGEDSQIVKLYEDYIELGASAIDDVDENISVFISGFVDSSVSGTYIITYTAKDNAGNIAILVREVEVLTDSASRLKELKEILEDENIPYTTEEDYNKTEYAKHHLNDKESYRLIRAHRLVSIAKDPDREWFSTNVDTPVIIAKPGGEYSLNLQKAKKDGSVYAPVDNDKLRIVVRVQRSKDDFEYITNVEIDNYAYWDGKGILKIHVPDDLIKGRVLVGIRPKFDNVATSAIAQRWSTLISAEVWPIKSNVMSLKKEDVLFPIEKNNKIHLSVQSKFSQVDISRKVAILLKNESIITLPLVVENTNLLKGDLVSFMFNDVNPYSGRIYNVETRGNQQFIVLVPEYFDVYDIVGGDDDFLINEGLYPEHIIFREDESIATDINESDPTEFTRNRKKEKEENKFFEKVCDKGTATMTFSPKLSLEKMEASVDFVLFSGSQKTECKWTATSDEIDFKNATLAAGPMGIIMRLFGSGGKLYTYGEVKIAAKEFLGFGIKGGYSTKKGGNFKILGSLETVGGRNRTNLLSSISASKSEATLSGSIGAKLDFNALSADGYIGYVLSYLNISLTDIGIKSKAGLSISVVSKALNSREVYDSQKSSGLAVDIAADASVSPSGSFLTLIEFLDFTAKPSIAYKEKLALIKADVTYIYNKVNDDGQGNASLIGLSLKSSFLKSFLPESIGVLSPKDDLSSVFNDPSENITYDVGECAKDKDYKIASPGIGCAGWMCGMILKPIVLCQGRLTISPIIASARVEKEAVTTATIINKAKDLTVNISGSPLRSSVDSIGLKENSEKQLRFAKLCPVTPGVYRGITSIKSEGMPFVDTVKNIMICHDDDNRGDPHIVTGDGLGYDFFASGDYILSRIHDVAGYEIQARFLPGYKTSWPQGIALRVGDDIVEIQGVVRGGHSSSSGVVINALAIWINGKKGYFGLDKRYQSYYSEDSIGKRVVELPSGGIIAVTRTTSSNVLSYASSLTIIWPDNIQAKSYGVILNVASHGDPFVHIQIARPDDFSGQEEGLMGNNDGDPNNDFVRRNGQVLGGDNNLSFTELYALFGSDWLVKSNESLFRNSGAIKPEFPKTVVTLTPEQRALGENACRALIGFYREACIMDVGLTGSVDLVQEYYSNTEDLNEISKKINIPNTATARYTINASQQIYDTNSLNYRKNININYKGGVGRFILLIRPPRGRSIELDTGGKSVVSEGNFSTGIHVNCMNENNATDTYLYPETGAIQLWSQDPLSGTAQYLYKEIPLSCIDETYQPNLIDYSNFPIRIEARLLEKSKFIFQIDVRDEKYGNYGLKTKIFLNSVKVSDSDIYVHDFKDEKQFRLSYTITDYFGHSKTFSKYISLINYNLSDKTNFPLDIDIKDLNSTSYTFEVNVVSPLEDKNISIEMYIGHPNNGNKVSNTNKYTHDFKKEKSFTLYYVASADIQNKIFSKNVSLINYKVVDKTDFLAVIDGLKLVDFNYTFETKFDFPLDNNISIEMYIGHPDNGNKVSDTNVYKHDFRNEKVFTLFYVVSTSLYTKQFSKNIELFNYKIIDNTSFQKNIGCKDLVDGKYTFDINVTSFIDDNLSVKVYTRPWYGSTEEKVTEGTSFTLDFLKSSTYNVRYVVTSKLGESKTYYKQISYTPSTFIDNTFPEFTKDIHIDVLTDGKYIFDINISTIPQENLNMEIFTSSTSYDENESFVKVSNNNKYEHDFLNGLKRFYLKYNVKTAGGCGKEYLNEVYLTGYRAIDHSIFPTEINASSLNNGQYTFEINVSSPLYDDISVEIFKGYKNVSPVKVSDSNTYTHDFFRDHSFDLYYYVYDKNGESLGGFKKDIELLNYEFTDNTDIKENIRIGDLNNGKYTFDINVSSSIDEDMDILIEVRDNDTGESVQISSTNTYTHDFINGKKNFTLYYRVKSLAGYTFGIKNIRLVDYRLNSNSSIPSRVDIRDLVDGKYTFEMNITSPFDENLSFATYNINPEHGGHKVADGRFYTYDFNQKSSFGFHYGATTESGYREMFYQYVRLKNDELVDHSTFPNELVLSDLNNEKYTFELNLTSVLGIPFKVEMYRGDPKDGGVKISDSHSYVHDFTEETSFSLYYKVIFSEYGYERVYFKKRITLLGDKLTMFTKNQQEFLAKYFGDSFVLDVEVSKDRNLTYISEGKNGLTILDTSDITKPQKVGTYDTSGYIYSLALSKDESKIYIADTSDGFSIIDISNVTEPKLMATIATEGLANSITLSKDGTIAYVSDGENGLLIINVEDSDNPWIKSHVDTAGNCGQSLLSLDEMKLYIADAQNGLLVVDISNLEEPTVINNFITEGFVYGIALSNEGNTIYLADYLKGLVAVDVKDVNVMSIVGKYEESTTQIVLSEDNTKAYIGIENALLVLNITDLNNIVIDEKYNTYANISGMKISSDMSKAYLANVRQGFTILDLEHTPISSSFITYPTNGQAYGVALSYDEKKVYVANGKNGFLSIDISDDHNFSLVENIDTGDDTRDILISGAFAYLTNADSGLTVVDLFEDTLQIINTFDTDGWTHDIQHSDSQPFFVYLADGSAGFKIVEEKESLVGETYVYTLQLYGSCSTEGEAHSLAVSKNKQIVYLVNHNNTMVVIDISNLAEPKIIARWQNENGRFEHITLSKDNSKAYIADGNNGLIILDISNPLQPILLHTINVHGYAETIVLTKNELLAYVTTGGAVAMVDISNVVSPRWIKSYPMNRYTDGIVLNKNETKAYVAAGSTGLVGLDLTIDKVYYQMNFNTNDIKMQLPKGINVTLNFDIKLDRTDIIQLGNYDGQVESNEYKNALIPIPIISQLGKTGQTKMTVIASFGSIQYTRTIYINVYK